MLLTTASKRPATMRNSVILRLSSICADEEIIPVSSGAIINTMYRAISRLIATKPTASRTKFMRKRRVVHPNTFSVLTRRIRRGTMAMKKLTKLIKAMTRMSTAILSRMYTVLLLFCGCMVPYILVMK